MKQPWRFQIHLSTAIVLMFVAGGLLWANMRERENVASRGNMTSRQGVGYGWPCVAVDSVKVYCLFEGKPARLYSTTFKEHYLAGGIDLVVALVVLLGVGYVCERIIK